ncbi:MAG: sugar phosphate nucleotidyltransferase [Acidobacteriota bacterium]|nr:sugar phosphate nucleotidyltransferase [Acidobacteriota bacterium]
MQALILAGGSGTRFWPASRKLRPKQLLQLAGDRTLLRATFERLSPVLDPADIWVCTNRDLAADVRRELPEVPQAQVLEEPVGRNTGPAIAWSLTSMPTDRRDEAVVSLHSDHWIADEEGFRATLVAAVAQAEHNDRVVALGVVPRWAETGYGYMEAPGPPAEGSPVREVEEFLEKPDRETAERFAASGRHFWNSGIFVFRASTLLSRLSELEPGLMASLAEIEVEPSRLGEVFACLESKPIDTAVMERLETMHTLVLDCGWSDLGSWEALAEVLEPDAQGNFARGDAVAIDATGNLLYADSGTVTVLGVEGLAVVQTGDAVLVTPLARSQEVRRIVAELKQRDRDELL